MNATFFNTIHLSGDDLAQAIATAKNQEDAVLAVMADGKLRAPSEVWQIGVDAGRRWLLTSVRRAMSNLEHDERLTKTDVRIPSPHGSFEHCWVLAGSSV